VSVGHPTQCVGLWVCGWKAAEEAGSQSGGGCVGGRIPTAAEAEPSTASAAARNVSRIFARARAADLLQLNYGAHISNSLRKIIRMGDEIQD
jgi:hypothetical protein